MKRVSKISMYSEKQFSEHLFGAATLYNKELEGRNLRHYAQSEALKALRLPTDIISFLACGIISVTSADI